MAYTKYSLTPANNTAAPPDGAPEGMLPSAVNDTMRDMMAQIRDCGDGIRDGTYTMTAPKITGGTITGSTINNSAIGGTTAAAGKFTTLEATGVATFSAGAVGTPAITTTGDTNTGIFFPAADTIAFTEGGTESMRIDSSGNVGIGTSSPATKLQISESGAGPTINLNRLGDTSGNAVIRSTGSTGTINASITLGGGSDNLMTFATGATASERMRITSAGKVGIGVSSPAQTLDVSGSVRLAFAGGNNYVEFESANNYVGRNSSGDLYLGVNGGQSFAFYVGATERMQINGSGIVTMSAYGAGAANFSAAGVISSVSDETWKTKDGVPNNPDAMLQKLEPGYWFYNEEKAPIFGADRQLGFYAQNVNEAIGNEAAPTPEEGKPWGYYDRSVLAITVMSLKNALTTIEELKQRIANLENKQ